MMSGVALARLGDRREGVDRGAGGGVGDGEDSRDPFLAERRADVGRVHDGAVDRFRRHGVIFQQAVEKRGFVAAGREHATLRPFKSRKLSMAEPAGTIRKTGSRPIIAIVSPIRREFHIGANHREIGLFVFSAAALAARSGDEHAPQLNVRPFLGENVMIFWSVRRTQNEPESRR